MATHYTKIDDLDDRYDFMAAQSDGSGGYRTTPASTRSILVALTADTRLGAINAAKEWQTTLTTSGDPDDNTYLLMGVRPIYLGNGQAILEATFRKDASSLAGLSLGPQRLRAVPQWKEVTIPAAATYSDGSPATFFRGSLVPRTALMYMVDIYIRVDDETTPLAIKPANSLSVNNGDWYGLPTHSVRYLGRTPVDGFKPSSWYFMYWDHFQYRAWDGVTGVTLNGLNPHQNVTVDSSGDLVVTPAAMTDIEAAIPENHFS
jgi:hypothetical protein